MYQKVESRKLVNLRKFQTMLNTLKLIKCLPDDSDQRFGGEVLINVKKDGS